MILEECSKGRAQQRGWQVTAMPTILSLSFIIKKKSLKNWALFSVIHHLPFCNVLSSERQPDVGEKT